MTTDNTIRSSEDVVRRDHLARLQAGPQAIAHLVKSRDEGKVARRLLTDEVAEIGRRNRNEALGKAKRGVEKPGPSRKTAVTGRYG